MNRTYRLLLFAAALSVFACDAPVNDRTQGGPLSDYVAKADSSYAWTVRGQFRQGTSEIIELQLQSQTWRDVLWRHQLYLIKPDRITAPQQGLMILAGGRWDPSLDTDSSLGALPDGSGLFVAIANRLGSVVAVLRQVPFQPLFGATEDKLIAYTLDRFLRTQDAEWPLLLPMVKSAVRAMDAAQAASKLNWDIGLDAFTLLGGSKRGWTTWLTAAVDQRVTALVPLVIDALNMASHFPYQTEVWGAPSEKIKPYTDLNLDVVLASEQGRALREIIDPFAYRSLLTQPKLIVIGTNDEYFPVDALNLYWEGLQGQKHALYLPNTGHDTEDFGRLIAGLGALHQQAAGGTPMPQLEWEYRLDSTGLTLCVGADRTLQHMQAWLAESDDRDFRDAQWRAAPLPSADGIFIQEVPRPSEGFTAVYVEAMFGLGDAAVFLSTNLAVVAAQVGGDVGRLAPSTAKVCDSRR